MDPKELVQGTRAFASRIIKLVASLPPNRLGDVFGRQILKSGTSVGANYREALGASSKRQFIYIIEIAQREADETLYWLELLAESGTVSATQLADLTQECRELLAILTATGRSAKKRT